MNDLEQTVHDHLIALVRQRNAEITPEFFANPDSNHDFVFRTAEYLLAARRLAATGKMYFGDTGMK